MKKILVILFVLFLMIGCSKSEKEPNIEEKIDKVLYDEISININLLNEQTDDYYLFFVKPGVLKDDLSVPYSGDYYGPIEIDGLDIIFKMSEHVNLSAILAQLEDKKLEIAITTREDYLLRNPLNDKVYIEFEDEYGLGFGFKATNNSFKVDVVDKYPDGVNSLAFPTYPLAIKLKFNDNVEIVNAYTARIREISSTSPTGLGMYAPSSPFINKQNYYNAAFSGDNFINFSGVLEIYTSDNKRVRYEEEPIVINFDANGNPKESRMTITIME